MKKIPTLFERNGVAIVKIDGSGYALINGEVYERYDAKNGRKATEGAIACCEPDPITGHHPHWGKVNPADFIEALKASGASEDGTYEAIGPHFRRNPYWLEKDILVKHGTEIFEIERTFEGIRQYLEDHEIEGIAFWLNGEPMCKIKRSDFGFKWNPKHIE